MLNATKLKKIKSVALDYNAGEKGNASRILAKKGIYIDIAGIEWKKDSLIKFNSDKRKFLFGFEPLKNNL